MIIKSMGMHAKQIFITARFRSGSTLLWNIFRNIPECHAFYEPCNDLLAAHIETGTTPPASHRGVTSYWDEYLPILKKLRLRHRQEFGTSRLYLESQDTYPGLEEYVSFLLKSASGKIPVLQFNRVDLRLPWLRKHFPDAVILHLTRNSRDNWFSMVRGLGESWRDPLVNTNYDLVLWSMALSHVFPFLFGPVAKTSYHRHYLLWKLSAIMGELHSDVTLDFDNDLLGNSRKTVLLLADLAGSVDVDIERLANLVDVPETGGWRDLADEHWFEEAEAECDALLEDLGLLGDFGRKPLKSIRRKHLSAWNREGAESTEGMASVSAMMFGALRLDWLCLSKKNEQYVLDYENIIHSQKLLLDDATTRKNSAQQEIEVLTKESENLTLRYDEALKGMEETQEKLQIKEQELEATKQGLEETQEKLHVNEQELEATKQGLAETQEKLHVNEQELEATKQGLAETQDKLHKEKAEVKNIQGVLEDTRKMLTQNEQVLREALLR